MSPLEQLPACTEDLNSILMSSILESKVSPALQEQPTIWKALISHIYPCCPSPALHCLSIQTYIPSPAPILF